MSNTCRVLFFVKYPTPGSVKTRLGKALGHDAAADLYEAFVADELAALAGAALPVTVYCDPCEHLDRYRGWLGRDYDYALQQGDDIGQRMASALRDTFHYGADSAILIGSDIPGLEAQDILAAQRLVEHSGAVLAPSTDGGYTLIGFRADSFLPSVFESIPWSTDSVLARTLAAFEAEGFTPSLLPEMLDMDTVADLKSLLRRYPTGGPACTMNALRSMRF